MSSDAMKWVRKQIGLTPSERVVLNEIAWRIKDPCDHCAPYIREIAETLSLKINTIKKIGISVASKNI